MDAIIRPEKADAGHNADSGRLREVVVLSKKVYIFLADGFEDIEGLTVVDLLRRAQIDIKTVSIKDTKEVQTAHGISLLTDLLFDEVDFTDADMLVLPGGMPGTKYLAGSKPLTDLLTDFYNKGKKIAAICAAPSVFSGLGFLKGRKATSYPSFMEVIAGDGAVTSERGCGRQCDYKQRPWYCSRFCTFSHHPAGESGKSRRNRRICGIQTLKNMPKALFYAKKHWHFSIFCAILLQ